MGKVTRSPRHGSTSSPSLEPSRAKSRDKVTRLKEKDILDIFKKSHALLQGHFKLSSGLHSKKYLQCALVLQYPRYAKQLCQALAKRFKEERPTVVCAPAIGGILVSYEVSKVLGCRSVFTERENGKMDLRRGFEINKTDRVLVVEDVITTGGSTKEVIDVVRQRHARLVGVGAIINRSCKSINFGVKFESLLNLSIKTFKQEDCHLCKKGIPIVKPGSRKF